MDDDSVFYVVGDEPSDSEKHQTITGAISAARQGSIKAAAGAVIYKAVARIEVNLTVVETMLEGA